MGGVCSGLAHSQRRGNGVDVSDDEALGNQIGHDRAPLEDEADIDRSFCVVKGEVPSLLQLSLVSACKSYVGFHRDEFARLPSDLAQLLFDLLCSRRQIQREDLVLFEDSSLSSVKWKSYPGVDDPWIDFLSLHADSLLYLDFSHWYSSTRFF
jgi:hypothetical protein